MTRLNALLARLDESFDRERRFSADVSHEDSGPAIPEAAIPRLFERFFRGDPSRAGTAEHHGLGLAVVRGVCAQLGASVSAHNRADGWVTFTIRG